MTEPDVALTDFFLSATGLVLGLAIGLGKTGDKALRLWLSLMFLSIGAACLSGGISHGFFLNVQSPISNGLWLTTMLASGVTGLAMWAVGARLLFSRRVAAVVVLLAIVEFAAYCAIILLRSRAFWIVSLASAPPVLFLLAAIGVRYWRTRHPSLLMAQLGLIVSIVASVLQHLHVGVHEIYFTYNALYHCLQAVALALFFVGARRMVETEQAPFECAAPGVEIGPRLEFGESDA